MKIRAYTLDSSKLLKRGAPEYDPHQEQAKTDVTLNGHIGQSAMLKSWMKSSEKSSSPCATLQTRIGQSPSA